MEAETKITVIGFLSSALNIIFYGSPLSAMKILVKTKSVELVPFLVTVFYCLNGGIWTFYAFLVGNWFLGVPNGIIIILGIIQLAFYVVYWDPSPSEYISVDLEEGGQRKRLLPPSTLRQ